MSNAVMKPRIAFEEGQVLLGFYIHYQAWHAAGAADGRPFSRSGGLCSNFNHFMKREHGNLTTEARSALRLRLKQQFLDAGLDGYYPFNAGEEDYDRQHDAQQTYLNPARIAWVVAAVQKGFASAAD